MFFEKSPVLRGPGLLYFYVKAHYCFPAIPSFKPLSSVRGRAACRWRCNRDWSFCAGRPASGGRGRGASGWIRCLLFHYSQDVLHHAVHVHIAFQVVGFVEIAERIPFGGAQVNEVDMFAEAFSPCRADRYRPARHKSRCRSRGHWRGKARWPAVHFASCSVLTTRGRPRMGNGGSSG